MRRRMIALLLGSVPALGLAVPPAYALLGVGDVVIDPTNLVQNIKLAEVHAIGTNDRVRAPRRPLSGERRAQVEAVIRSALDSRPVLPEF